MWCEPIPWDARPRSRQAAGCYSWIPTKCSRPWVRVWALCCSMLSPGKMGKITLQLPHKDAAVGDATLQKASKALPRCRDILESIRSCSSHSHSLHSHLQTTAVYTFSNCFFLEQRAFVFTGDLTRKKKKSIKFLYIFKSNASTQHFHKTV